MFALVLDEVAHIVLERLPWDDMISQDFSDHVSNPSQADVFIEMLAFEVADALGGDRVTRLQFLKDHVLFRMMAAIGIILKITDDSLYNFVIRPLTATEDT